MISNECPIHGVGTNIAATHADSHIANAELHPTSAGLAAIAAPILIEYFFKRTLHRNEINSKRSPDLQLHRIQHQLPRSMPQPVQHNL